MSIVIQILAPFMQRVYAKGLCKGSINLKTRSSHFLFESFFYLLLFLFYQGALIASSLVLIQQTEHSCPKVAKFREIYAKVISDKHEDIIAKFGATLAQGILDAGGY